MNNFFSLSQVIFIVRTILQAIYGAVGPTPRLTAQINNLSFAGYFTTFATSFATTLLIAYRIHAVAARGTAQNRFRHITAIVVESGAAYSLALLVGAIIPVVAGETTVLNARVMALGFYAVVLVNLIAVRALFSYAAPRLPNEPKICRAFPLQSWSRVWPCWIPPRLFPRLPSTYPAFNSTRVLPTRQTH
jgi:hypothetical protein